MARKRTPAPKIKPTPRRGRPPGDPKTALARWIQAAGITVTDFHGKLHQEATRLGMVAELVPETKTLRDIVNMRHRASLETVMLVRGATGGEVDLDQWVDDLSAR